MYGSGSTNYDAMSDHNRSNNRRSKNPTNDANDSSIRSDAMRTQGRRISTLNILNAVAFAVNVVFTYGIGVLGIGNLPNNNEVSEKYQTLVTPAGWAFAIWALIFIMQFVFVVVQLLPKYSSSPLVLTGVRYWYVFTCLFQAGWSVAFANEQIELSFVLIFLIWVTLVGILVFQYRIRSNFIEYVLLRFPFAIHCGWVTAATVLNANVLAVSEQISEEDQVAAAIFSLSIMFTVAFWTVWSVTIPEYIVAIVISWANAGIAYELDNPMEQITAQFSDIVLNSLSIATTWIFITILVLVALRILYIPISKRSRSRV